MANQINASWVGMATDDCIVLSDNPGLIATLGVVGLAILQRGKTLLVVPVEWLRMAAYYAWLADRVAGLPEQSAGYYWQVAECQLLERALGA